MLSETMQKVSEAEQKAQAIVQEAKQQAADIVGTATTQAKQCVSDAESAAKEEAKVALAQAEQAGIEEKERYALELNEKLEEAAKHAMTKAEAAIDALIEGLV